MLHLIDSETGRITLISAIHVDDMIVTGSTGDCLWLRESLAKVSPVHHKCPLSWHIGYAFERNEVKRTVTIGQTAFVETRIECFDILSSRSTLADPRVKVRPKRNEEPGGN